MEKAQHYKDWANTAGFDSHSEQREAVKLSVQGRIPSFAAGHLYRIGPASYTVSLPDGKVHSMDHWFDGYSQLYRFDLVAQGDSCSVTFASRHLVDQLVERVRKTGRVDLITFAQKRDPCEGLFHKLKAVFMSPTIKEPGESNIGVTIHPNLPGLADAAAPFPYDAADISSLVALSDHARALKIDPQTLQPLGIAEQARLHPDLTGPYSGAHPQIDPDTGDVFNYNLFVAGKTTYRIFQTSMATGKTEVLAAVSLPGLKAAYLHSLFLTHDFVVLAVWSSHYAKGGAQVLWERNVLDAIQPFSADKKTQWLVVDRRHGRGLVGRFASDAGFCFHSVNAWDEVQADGSTDVVCEAVVYENLDIIHRFYYANLVSSGANAAAYRASKPNIAPSLIRYRCPGIPAASKAVPAASSIAVLPVKIDFTHDNAKIGELPTFNPLFATRPSRYIYSLIDRGMSSFVDGIVKTDTQTGEARIWETPRHTPGESIFVPDGTGDEDGGVLLTVVLDGDRGKSYLLCLDARSMTELGRAEAPEPVALGFHGQHVPYSRQQ